MEQLISMGFPEEEARRALGISDGNVTQAVALLLEGGTSNADDPVALHRAIWRRDIDAIRLLAHEDRSKLHCEDAAGNTPLGLALRLEYTDLVHELLALGADPRLICGRAGFSALQEASFYQNEALLTDFHLHLLLMRQREWEERLPRFQAQLNRMPDFMIRIEWAVQSWVPMASRFSSHDTFRIVKIGRKLRIDLSEGEPTSFFFVEDSVWVVKHDQRTIEDALRMLRNPNFDHLSKQVHDQITNAGKRVYAVKLDEKSLLFKKKMTFFGRNKKSTVQNWKCTEVEMTGLSVCSVELKSGSTDLTSSPHPYWWCGRPIPSMIDYFANGHAYSLDVSKYVDRSVRNVCATLYMTDVFSLTKQHLVDILEIVSPVSAALAQIRDVFRTHMPEGFPVKLEIPLFPSVTATMTFTEFKSEGIDDSLVDLPEYERLR